MVGANLAPSYIGLMRGLFLFLTFALPHVAQAQTLMLNVENMRSDTGIVTYVVCREDEFEAALAADQACDISGFFEAQEPITQFGISLPAGRYAILVTHDPSRGPVTGFLTEFLTEAENVGVGFIAQSPPFLEALSFDDIAFDVMGRQSISIQIVYSDDQALLAIE